MFEKPPEDLGTAQVLLVVAVVLAILAIYPDYLDPLLHETLGIIALVFCSVMVVIGSLVIKRIVEIKV